MFLRIRNLITLFLFICLPTALFSQNARQYLRTGLTFVEAGNHADAIDQFTRALEIDPQYVQAYIERSRSYEATGELRKSADDLNRALTFEQKEPGLYYNAARILFILGNNREALELVNKCVSLNRKSDVAHLLQARIQMALEDYSGSLMSINRAIELKDNADNFYYRGQLSEIMKNIAQAEADYKKAISKNEKYTEAYLALAVLKLRLSKPQDAIENCNTVLASDPLNRNALLIRSRAFVNLTRYPEAIDDISKILASNPEDRELYFTRGTYYQDFTQHQAAINDFSKVLLLDPQFSEAIFRRAASYEQIGDFKSAIRDYEKLTVLSSSDETAKRHLSQAKERLFELNRESDAPLLELIEPIVHYDSTFKIPRTKRTIKLRGRIHDASDIALVS
ncbi:MAG TPA: tetratricopeptide repeat protein, partial [Bacteroidales bacterium]|nr:tetratricopeptide repeat protein [Bacteroidales bacterium]